LEPGGRADFVVALSYFVPGHGLIFSKQETGSGTFSWNCLSKGRITALPDLHPAAAPILSVDCKWAAWIERESIAIEPLDGDEAPLQVQVGDLQTWSYVLRTVDVEREEIELIAPGQRVVLGLDGRVKSSGVPRLVWDTYRDDGPYRVSWNANGHSFTHNAL